MTEHGARREARIRALFPLVRKIARRLSRLVAGSEMDDLIGDGCIGLIRAVDAYDPTRGPSLEQFAGRVIAGAMLNGMRRLDPISERVRREIRDAAAERYHLASERGEMPGEREMEERRPKLRRASLYAYRNTPLSLDSPLPSGERIAVDWSGDPSRVVGDLVERELVREAMRTLSPRYRRLLSMHYFGELSLHQISRRFAISPQRASQLHQAALNALRTRFHGAR